MQVGIIGVGLIGGSMAVDLKNRGFPSQNGVERFYLRAVEHVTARSRDRKSVV